jgi:DNA-binding response OmpR family regulator
MQIIATAGSGNRNQHWHPGDPPSEPPAREESSRRRKILVVDDDRSYLKFTTVNLNHAGYDVVAAVDAVGAISTAVKEAPDLIILDIGLPGGNGFVVMERLRSNLALMGIPIIVVTARNEDANRPMALRAGACELLQKPVMAETLLGEIRKALGRPARQLC